jgi:hypothetical protein
MLKILGEDRERVGRDSGLEDVASIYCNFNWPVQDFLAIIFLLLFNVEYSKAPIHTYMALNTLLFPILIYGERIFETR